MWKYTQRKPGERRVPAARRRSCLEPLEGRLLMAAGFLDPSFDGDGRVVRAGGTGGAVAVQADGRVVTAGAVEAAAGGGGAFDFFVARYNADGSPDSSFGTGGAVQSDFAGRSDIARAVTVQPDGKIVVAGSSGRLFTVARYNPNGALDTTFGGTGAVTTEFETGPNPERSSGAALDVAVQADGKIVASGSFRAASGDTSFALARYNPDGTLDTTFDSDGRVTTGSGLTAAYAVALAPGGRIVAGGTADTGLLDAALAVYTAQGALDGAFGQAGIVPAAFGQNQQNDEIRDVAVDVNGDTWSIVAAGPVEGGGFTVARVGSDGAALGKFEAVEFPGGPGGTASNSSAATALALDADRHVLAAGYTTDGLGRPENFALARFNSDGVLDRTFGFRGVAVTDFRPTGPGGGGADPQDLASAVAVAPGGAIVVAGASNGLAAVARYLGAGSAAPAPVGVSGDNALTLDGSNSADDVRLYNAPGPVPRFVADVSGSLYLAPLGVGRARVSTLGGDDLIRPTDAAFNFPIEVDAGAGQDTILGGAGDDILVGGDGNDLLDGAGGRDRLEGGAGSDTADYSSRTAPLDVTLDGAANDGAAGELDNVLGDIETVRGGSGADRIVGSSSNNVLYGNGGDDVLDGGRGSDVVLGGDGDDLLVAAEAGSGPLGSDVYMGGAGFDTVDYTGRSARLLIRLGLYATSVGASRERDMLRDVEGAVGGSGADRIEGNQYNNRLEGGGGNDVLLGRAGNDTLLGGAGDDVLTDSTGTNTLDGGPGNDTVNGVSEAFTPVLLEAESATLSGPGASHDVTGFTGTGYADYGSSAGQFVEFTFDNTAGAGVTRTLTFRYANGGSTDRPLELKLNGAVINPRLSFAPTGAWTTWKTVTVTVQLAAGSNKIRLTSLGAGPNLDSLTVS